MLVRITRRHMTRDNTPYKGVAFCAFSFPDHDNSVCQNPVGFPESWSFESRCLIASRCLVRNRISVELTAVQEEDVPQWLWRREPAETSLVEGAEPGETRDETSLQQVIDRIAGAWTYSGWKGGYFDSEEDARAFFDEIRWLICRQRISPNLAQWQSTGLYWAYGLRTDEADSFVTDYRTGGVRRAEAGDLPPHGAVINGTHGALAGEGGVWDLWQREGRILSSGGQCGANVSGVTATGVGATGNALPDILRIGDSAAALVNTQTTHGGPKRRITLDAIHPHAGAMADQPLTRRGLSDATYAGIAISLRHIQAILDAAPDLTKGRRSDRRDSASLRFAIQSARQAHLPEQLIQQALARLDQGERISAGDVLGIVSPDHATPPITGDGSVTVFQIDDETMASSSSKSAGDMAVIHMIARNGWMGIPSGLQFENPANGWNTCPDSGAIRAAAGDGGFLFLDDTASAPAILNAPTFVDEDGQFDGGALGHATALLTIALDISLMVSTQPTPRLAKRTWDFRPLSLSPAGIASLLMAQGLAYDSLRGRALSQAFCALVTGTAYLTSAQLAEELGAFPGYADNSRSMTRVVQRHARALTGGKMAHVPDQWRREIETVWYSVLECGQLSGFRNAQVSLIAAAESETTITDCESPGLYPSPALVHWRRQAHGSYERALNPSVSKALKSLGYCETDRDAILRHVVGHGTLMGAPGVNHETLKKRGFTDAALKTVESALATTQHIGLVFNSAVLGDHYCIHMLGFSVEELQDDNFDMLAALGFSDAGIEAANIYCCGANTLEGAPRIAPEHIAVFDCADIQGDRGCRQVSSEGIIKMMEAAQPALSGAIGHVLTLPAAATIDDCKEAIFLAWRSGLKSLVFERRYEDCLVPAIDAQDVEVNTVFTVVDNGQPHHMAKAPETQIELQNEPGEEEPEVASKPNYEIAVTDREETPVGDAETPRRATSLPTQSTASVTSSADAVVEQRQV